MNRQVENGTLRDKKKEIERKRERKKKRSRVKICDRQKCFSDCGTSYPRKKKKFPSLLFARRSYCSVTLRKKIALKKKKEEKDRSWSDCRLQIIETGLIKITKIHRVAKRRRQWFFHASPPWELFPLVLAVPGAKLAFAPQVCVFCQEKHRERENNNRKRNVCTERGMGGERETTRRERPWEEKGDALIVWYTRKGAGGRQRRRKWSKETCDLTVALFLLALFAVVAAFHFSCTS